MDRSAPSAQEAAEAAKKAEEARKKAEAKLKRHGQAVAALTMSRGGSR